MGPSRVKDGGPPSVDDAAELADYDGVVVATWRYVRGAPDTVEVAPFHALSRRVVRGVEREVGEIGAFLGREPSGPRWQLPTHQRNT